MPTPYLGSALRRLGYTILIGFAVLGPLFLISRSFTGVIAPKLEMPAFYSGLAAIACLCIWGAIYVRDEPQRVRILLIWIAVLFLLMISSILMHSYMH